MSNIIKGKVWKYGDDINTDVIYPGKYTYKDLSSKEMASHALEDLDSEFTKKVKKGDILVAGRNFGMGSSREQAVTSLKYAGIAAIIAKSFSRIYFRNAINQGIPAVQSQDFVDAVKDGEQIEIDFEKGIIKCNAGKFDFPSFPQKIMDILGAGGLTEYTKRIIRK